MAGVSVFLCRCCGELEPPLDLAALGRRIAGEAGVVHVSVRDTLCLPGDAAALIGAAREAGAGGTLIAACPSCARGGEVQGALAAAFGRARVRLVDLREGCAWIHRNDPAGAGRKAAALVRMGLGALTRAAASEDASVAVQPACLVVGAGPAGLAAAITVARAGHAVHLVERGPAAGGMLRLISHVYPGDGEAQERLRPALAEIAVHPQITFHPRTRITAATGYAGDFKVRLAGPEGETALRAGAVILATGAGVWLPRGLYRYGELPGVLTLMELERRRLAAEPCPARSVFIQCAGARCAERPYCATVCCPSSLKNALLLKRTDPAAEVTILHRDIMTPGHRLEGYYRRALEAGIRFLRFSEERPPVVQGGEKVAAVTVHDALSGVERTLAADQVVLATPLTAGADNAKLAALFGLPLDRYGFLQETYPLHPLETRQAGVFLCGSARWPVGADEAALQGAGAAVKALALLSRQRLTALTLGTLPGGKPGHARVEAAACSGCGQCAAACPYAACTLQRLGGRSVSRVNKLRCRGCGLCTAVCPNGTVQLPEQNAHAVGAMIRRAFAGEGS